MKCYKDRNRGDTNTCACGIVYCNKCFEYPRGQKKMTVICSKCDRQVCGYCSADLCTVCDRYVCRAVHRDVHGDIDTESQCLAFMCGMDCGSVICCIEEASCNKCKLLLCPTCMFNGRLHTCKPLIANCGHRVYAFNHNTISLPNTRLSSTHPIQWCTLCPLKTYCVENCGEVLHIHSAKHTIKTLLLVIMRINFNVPAEVIHIIFEYIMGRKVSRNELPCLKN